MEAGLGWVWDAQNHRVIGWFAIVGIVNALLAVGVALRWLPALVVASLWSVAFGALWLFWSLLFWIKIGRLDDPEWYLFVLSPAFVVAYAAVILGCTVLVERGLTVRRGACGG